MDGYWEERWTGFREGSARIALEWDGGRAEAAIFDKRVPRISAAFLAALPLEIEMFHVAWSGDMIMSTEPVPGIDVLEAENDVRLPWPGDIGWDPKVREITVTYNLAECKGPIGANTIVIFGQVETGLRDLATFGRRRRYEGVATLRFSRIEGEGRR
jgi:hypothetical protein